MILGFLGDSTTNQSDSFAKQEDDVLLREYLGCVDEQDASQQVDC